MKRRTIQWIIGMMSMALLGLIGFQWYWIESVISSNEERFKRDVLDALHSVSEKLEKQEALYTIHQRMAYTSQFSHSSQFGYGPQTPTTHQGAGDGTQENPTGFNIYFDFQTGTITRSDVELDEMQKAETTRLRQIQEQNQQSMQEQFEKAFRKSEMIFQVLENVLVPERSLLSRFNPEQLDSLLKSELADRGIDIGVDYAIVAPGQNRFVLLKDRNSKKALQESELRATLFPNDLIGEQNWLVVDFPDKQQYLLKKIWFSMASSGLLVLVIVFSFGYSIHTIIRQKKLSEMKNDFINNMTHELKTPIATISLASEALSDKDISESPGLKDRYLKVISDENKRLGEQVERVLQMAALDKRDIELRSETLDLHELVQAAIDKTILQVEKREGEIKYIDNADRKTVYGDRTHLINILVNLIDNANKYSPEAPTISIRLFNKSDHLMVAVQDRGIGMTKEAISHIFQKFYRVPTGNIHNVKGFGLGLAYVKTMTELHGGTVSVESESGKGSKFMISLPLHYE